MSEALWPQLLSSALVGTDRRPCRPSPVSGPLAALLGERDELDPGGLLSAAAALTVARRAGAKPARLPLPDPAPEETAHGVPDKASVRLGLLLVDAGGGDHRQRKSLLREWLELAQQGGFLAPPRHLTGLIEAAGADPGLRAAVVAVGGARLGWLAAQGPGRWAWVEQPRPELPDPGDWQTGHTAARVRYLESVRAADPAQGRALLSEVWPQERAADLAALIGACAAGLGPQDEPWLEKALDDKRVQIREAAAQLLAAIPDSAYRKRMADRALACCRPDGPGRLTVTPPAEFDASMRRDALSHKAPQGWGERAWWLVQVVAAAPLSCWSTLVVDPATHDPSSGSPAQPGLSAGDGAAVGGLAQPGFSAAHDPEGGGPAGPGLSAGDAAGSGPAGPGPRAFDPATLLDYQISDDWAAVLREGWLRAAVAQRDAGWALPLCRLPAVRGGQLTELAAVLPSDVLATLAADALRHNTDRIGELLSAAPPPWPPELAEIVIGWLDRSTNSDNPGWWHLLGVIERGLHPAAAGAVNAILDRCGDGRYREILERLAMTLQIRYDMHQEFV